jgi:hypothetical protein
MIPRSIAQVVVGDNAIVAQSDDFDDTWRPDIDRVVEGFGLPAGVNAPECLFALPLNRRFVTVVSVLGRRFRFLILPRSLYDVIPDPFAIAARFPPKWDGPLPSLEWPEEPLPPRTVAQLDAIFKYGDGPFLYGACQTLVDTGRIAIERDSPQPDLCRSLWNLLPASTQRRTSVATFAYSTALGFGLAVLPTVPNGGIPGYLSEDQARDYPESRYERELQFAVEHNDQRSLDRLLARRSSAETLRLAIWILLGAVAFTVVTRILMAI